MKVIAVISAIGLLTCSLAALAPQPAPSNVRGKSFHEALATAGIQHVWIEGPGAHEGQVWRRHLHGLAPRLFQEGPSRLQRHGGLGAIIRAGPSQAGWTS